MQPRSLKRGWLQAALPLVALVFPALAGAQERMPCPSFFVGGQPPALLNPRLAERTHELCFSDFAVLASGVSRGPLWSGEHPTRATLAAARQQERLDLFHPESTLPPEDRAEPEDYVRSGFDRGHMTPSGDMPTREAQEQSFSLANIVPQAPMLNRETWERIESTVRRRAEREGALYVVTGPVFRGGHLQQIGRGVLVPTAVFKAVYDPVAGTAGAYVCTNTNTPACRTMSIAALARLTGLDVFPALPQAVKMAPPRLPVPHPREGRHGRHQGT